MIITELQINDAAERLRESRILIERTYPYAQAGDIQRVRKYGQILEEEYREDGIFIKALLPAGSPVA